MDNPVHSPVVAALFLKRSKNQQFLPHVLLEKCGDAMLMIAFALLRKPSTTYLTVWILTSPLLLNLRTMAKYYFL